jgi:colicin import membrane protein
MKIFKTITMLFVATVISFTVSAQATPAAKTETKTTTSSSSKSSTTQATPAPAAAADKPGANDKVNKELKGPNGEVVYTGPKGGNYYINKNTGKKAYLKAAATAAPAKK